MRCYGRQTWLAHSAVLIGLVSIELLKRMSDLFLIGVYAQYRSYLVFNKSIYLYLYLMHVK